MLKRPPCRASPLAEGLEVTEPALEHAEASALSVPRGDVAGRRSRGHAEASALLARGQAWGRREFSTLKPPPVAGMLKRAPLGDEVMLKHPRFPVWRPV